LKTPLLRILDPSKLIDASQAILAASPLAWAALAVGLEDLDRTTPGRIAFPFWTHEISSRLGFLVALIMPVYSPEYYYIPLVVGRVIGKMSACKRGWSVCAVARPTVAGQQRTGMI